MLKVWVIWLVLIPLSNTTLPQGTRVEQEILEKIEDYEPITFDDTRLRHYTEDPDFDYSESAQESWWTRFKAYLQLQWTKLIIWLFGEVPQSSFLLFFLKILPYLIFLGLCFFFLWLFYRLNPGRALIQQPHSNRVFRSEDEAIVESQDIDQMIENALQKEDYRLAVRYQYLLVLQFLSTQDLINYQSDKTNADYAKEIDQEMVKRTFLDLSRIYDYTWYGNFIADRTRFDQMRKGYHDIVTTTKASNEKK